MTTPFKLPRFNTRSVARISPKNIDVVGFGAPCNAIAQYRMSKSQSEDLTLTILEWIGEEYEESYVLLLHINNTNKNLHNPEGDFAVFSRNNLVEAINGFVSSVDRSKEDIINTLQHKTSEPWNTEEEYKEFLENEQSEAKYLKERQKTHEKAREERDKYLKERRKTHEKARKEWAEEKNSREIVRELERNKHEFNIPNMPEVTDEIKELNKKYTNGEITFTEFEEMIDQKLE